MNCAHPIAYEIGLNNPTKRQTPHYIISFKKYHTTELLGVL